MKKLFAAAALILGLSAAAYATPIRYVQISTNTLTQQSGSINIQGATISTTTVSSATLTNATIGNATITSAYIPAISTTTISSATITNATISTGKITTGTFTSATISTTTISSATITNATVTGTANITTDNVATGNITSAVISTMTVSSATLTQATINSTATLNGAISLNGSAGTSGQVATSQGPGTATHWTTLSASAGGSSGQIQYNNGSALAGFPSAVTASSVTISTPTLIMGTKTNDSAPTGYDGEFISTAPAPSRFANTAHYTDAASMSLTAGDWDVTLRMDFQPNSSTGCTDFAFGIGTNPGDDGTGLSNPNNFMQFNANAGSGGQDGKQIGPVRESLSTTSTLYYKVYQDGATGTNPIAHVFMQARRVR